LAQLTLPKPPDQDEYLQDLSDIEKSMVKISGFKDPQPEQPESDYERPTEPSYEERKKLITQLRTDAGTMLANVQS
jgi:hypothetical protein